uniref:acetylglutamate kinase n=1 Tax=Pinguiococcus pyrenoidosus TaxID=172671 RepID=A0A7R9UEB9_9STRA
MDLRTFLLLLLCSRLCQGLLGPRVFARPQRALGAAGTESEVITPAVTGEVLARSLPYIQRYAGEYVVVKYGGHAMVDPSLAKQFATDMVLLQAMGIKVVIVHGGGPQIKNMLTRLDIESHYVEGLRVTDAATMEVAEMVLCGSINKGIVASIQQAGGVSVGLSGKDGSILRTRKAEKSVIDPQSGRPIPVDLGLVGEPERVDISLITKLCDQGVIPVIAPIGMDAKGNSNNVNADTAAGAIAGALEAKRLLLLTDVAGVLDKSMKLLPKLSLSDVAALVEDGTITGGMVPKLQTATDAVRNRVDAAIIMDGRVQHSALLELFTDEGVGTIISQ